MDGSDTSKRLRRITAEQPVIRRAFLMLKIKGDIKPGSLIKCQRNAGKKPDCLAIPRLKQ